MTQSPEWTRLTSTSEVRKLGLTSQALVSVSGIMFIRESCVERNAGQTPTGACSLGPPHVMSQGENSRPSTGDFAETQHSGVTRHVINIIMMGTRLPWARDARAGPSTASSAGTYPAPTIMRLVNSSLVRLYS